LTLPLLSYFSGHVFSKIIRNGLGAETRIEDLWIRYFCITTNITRLEQSVHTQGLLWRHVRASMTVLGFLPPMINPSGDVLVDGGYVNNVPVDVMAQYAQVLIAVDVEDKDLSMFDNLYNYGDGISGWSLLWYKLCRRQIRIPSFASMFLWLACLNHVRQLRSVVAAGGLDLYIRPPIEKYKLLDYGQIDEIIQVGYNHTKALLEKWLEKGYSPYAGNLKPLRKSWPGQAPSSLEPESPEAPQLASPSGAMTRNVSMVMLRNADENSRLGPRLSHNTRNTSTSSKTTGQ